MRFWINKIQKNRLLKNIVYVLMLVNVPLLTALAQGFWDLRQIKKREQAILGRTFPEISDAQVRIYLEQLMPTLTHYQQEAYGMVIKYTVYRGAILIGHAYQVREDIACPVCKDVRFFIGIRSDNTISSVILVNPFHLYGEPMPEEMRDEFLSQFLNRKISDTFTLHHNIKGITGATKTTTHFLDGILKIRRIHH